MYDVVTPYVRQYYFFLPLRQNSDKRKDSRKGDRM